MRDEADIIITNPPFSLFREFLAWIIEANKKFIILGNMNAIPYKEVFPHLKNNEIWLGYKSLNQDMYFTISDQYQKWLLDNKKEDSAYKIIDGVIMGRLASACWFTNIDHGRRHEKLLLDTMEHNLKFNKKLRNKFEKEYGEIKYPKYDNYDAIEVPYVECIPSDYTGAMGVPITFMDKYCPDQFEILWQASGNAYANAPQEILDELKFNPNIKYGGGLGTGVINGKAKYSRILIRAKEKEVTTNENNTSY